MPTGMNPMKHVIKVQRYDTTQPQYKTDCLLGAPHPMESVTVAYALITIGRIQMDMPNWDDPAPPYNKGQFSPDEQEVITDFAKLPASDWAIHNSFDGLYVSVQKDPANWNTNFRFAVYMEERHITFWKLKY